MRGRDWKVCSAKDPRYTSGKAQYDRGQCVSSFRILLRVSSFIFVVAAAGALQVAPSGTPKSTGASEGWLALYTCSDERDRSG